LEDACDLLIFTADQAPRNHVEDQKIAACGSSYSGSAYIRQRLVGWQAAFAAVRRSDKPAPTRDRRTPLLFTTHQAER
jgi:hypothetical protein